MQLVFQELTVQHVKQIIRSVMQKINFDLQSIDHQLFLVLRTLKKLKTVFHAGLFIVIFAARVLCCCRLVSRVWHSWRVLWHFGLLCTCIDRCKCNRSTWMPIRKCLSFLNCDFTSISVPEEHSIWLTTISCENNLVENTFLWNAVWLAYNYIIFFN